MQKWDRILIPSPAKRLMTSFCTTEPNPPGRITSPFVPAPRASAVQLDERRAGERPESARDDNLVGDGGQGGQEVDGLRPRADGEGDGIAAGCRVRPSDRLPERSGPGVIGNGHRECRRCKPVLQRLNQ